MVFTLLSGLVCNSFWVLGFVFWLVMCDVVSSGNGCVVTGLLGLVYVKVGGGL